MRFFITIFLCCCCGTGLYAQTQPYKKLGGKVSLEAASMNAAAVLQQLQQQTGYTFVYDLASLQQLNIQPVALSGTLGNALETLHRKYGLQFNLQGNNISVQKGAVPAAAKPTREGVLSGKIIDEENGEPVPGVTISVGEKKAVSSVDGSFTFQLPAAEYTALATAVGYGTKKITDIAVSDKEVTIIDIVLKREKGQLANVVVTASARKESVAALYQAQKNRAAISDGISAEQIARTPDKNVGEVIKRITGLTTVDNKYVVARGLSERYNGAMLNGQLMPSTELNRKQFSFDIIPSSIVENIVVYKTITPDLSAEFGGGLLAITTKSIPNQNFMTITAGTGYNNQTTGKPFRSLQLDNRAYLGGTPTHRYLLGQKNWNNPADAIKSYNNSGAPATAFSNNWTLYRFNAPVSHNYEWSAGKSITLRNGHRLGIIASAIYRNTFLTQKVKMSRDGFNGTTDVETGAIDVFAGDRYGFTANLSGLVGIGYQTAASKISLQTLYVRNYDQQLVLGAGEHADPSGYLMGYYDITQQATMLQNQLKGEHAIGKKGIVFSWMGNYIQLNKERPDNHQFYAKLQQKVDVRNADELNIQAPASTGISEGALRWWTKATEKNTGWDASLSVPFSIGTGSSSLKTTWKTGYGGWRKNRLFYVVNTGTQTNTEYYPSLSETFNPSKVKSIYFSTFGDDFSRVATLHAGYTMFDHKAGNWRLVWGVRAEYLDLNGANARLDSLEKDLNRGRGAGNKYDFSELRSKERNWNFFPSANLTYSLTAAMNLRLAYAKSIVRPDLRELSFFKEYDFEQGGDYEAKFVRSTKIHHLDLRYEWYPAAGEVLSVSFFYKKLNYPMEIYKEPGVRGSILINNKAAVNKGVEVELRKSLHFTHIPVLQQVTLYGNFTRLFSEVTPMLVDYTDVVGYKVTMKENILPKEARPQVGASNYLINGGMYYDSKLFRVSLSYNYVSNRTYSVVKLIYPQSLFERPLTALDAQLSVPVLKQKGEVRFNISNLLNSYSVIYSNRYESSEMEQHPPTSELLYQKNKDYIEYQSNPGRTASVILSYRF